MLHAERIPARNTDPATSWEAAEAITRSGVAAHHRVRILEAVRDNPDRTSAELAEVVGLDRWQVARRLPELRERGLVTNPGQRVCNACRMRSMTWRAVPEQLELVA